VKTTLPAFSQTLELIKEHSKSTAACVQTLGKEAEIDGSGGCVCSHSYFLSGQGKCIDEKTKNAKKRGFLTSLWKVKQPHADVPQMPACSSNTDCDAKLVALHASLSNASAACEARASAVSRKVDDVKVAFEADESKRQEKQDSTTEKLVLMREQNRLMVGQLKKYTELDTENKRLDRDMQNMLRDKRSLDAQLLLLRERAAQLERELQVLRAQSDAKSERCQEQVRLLRDGLASKGKAIPEITW
jgi:hypothetical protein